MKEAEFTVEAVEQQTRIIQFLDDKIYQYNSSAIKKYDGDQFTKIIRDQNDNIIAGVTGWAWAMVSEITLLWVAEQYRNKGLGKILLKAAEDEIISRGGATILLRSYSFQAPFFYEKNGYKIVYILDDFPNGHKHYTLVKRTTKPNI